MAVVLIGFFLAATRRRAISQIVGFLLLDNGIAADRVPDHRRRAARSWSSASPLDLLLAVLVLQVLTTRHARRLRRHRPGRTAGAARLMTPTDRSCTFRWPPAGRRGRGRRVPRRRRGGVARRRRRGRHPRPPASRSRTTGRPVAAAGGLLRADALTACMLSSSARSRRSPCWAGVAYLAAEATAGAPPARGPPVPASWCSCSSPPWPGGARRQPRRALGGGRGHHHRHRVPRRPPPQPRRRSRPPGSTSCSARSASPSPSWALVCVYYAAVHAGAPAEPPWTGPPRPATPPTGPCADPARHGLSCSASAPRPASRPCTPGCPTRTARRPHRCPRSCPGCCCPSPSTRSCAYKAIADAVLGPGFMRTLLLVGALASLAVAAALLIAQRDYKRMLAYSSIEHMGLVALGAAIGGRLAVAAALLHMLGHGLGQGRRCSAAPDRSCQPRAAPRSPTSAGWPPGARAGRRCSASGCVALLGLPPFSLFASELGIVRAGCAAGLGWVVARRVRARPGRLRRDGPPRPAMLLGAAPPARGARARAATPRRARAAGAGAGRCRGARARRSARSTSLLQTPPPSSEDR